MSKENNELDLIVNEYRDIQGNEFTQVIASCKCGRGGWIRLPKHPALYAPKPVENGELREQLAAIEHERWADWQKWCHKVLRENNPSPEQGDILERWDRQIATPYAELSEKEKQSDRDQVDRYWQLVETYIAQEKAKWVSQMEQVIGEDDEVPPRPTGKEYLTRSQRTAVSKNVLRAKQRKALAKLLDKENTK